MPNVRPLYKLYQLKITLNHTTPPIWRRVEVDSRIDLESFNHVIQIAMGWGDYHLHEFALGSSRYGRPDESVPQGIRDERYYRLDQLLRKVEDQMIYTYDLGDDWRHQIVLEEIRPRDPKRPLPCCVAGERAGPIEDCGGPPGYHHLLDAVADPGHPQHEEMVEWLGDHPIDPEAFDCEAVNATLATIFPG